MDTARIATQLGGKYTIEDQTIFDLKRTLLGIGIQVDFPTGDRIIGDCGGVPVTFDLTEKSLYAMELEFFSAIRRNPVHIVCNHFEMNDGYMGESASIELAYAILHQRPAILLRAPSYAAHVPKEIVRILEGEKEKLFIVSLDMIDPEEIRTIVQDAIDSELLYHATIIDEVEIMREVGALLSKYREQCTMSC